MALQSYRPASGPQVTSWEASRCRLRTDRPHLSPAHHDISAARATRWPTRISISITAKSGRRAAARASVGCDRLPIRSCRSLGVSTGTDCCTVLLQTPACTRMGPSRVAHRQQRQQEGQRGHAHLLSSHCSRLDVFWRRTCLCAEVIWVTLPADSCYLLHSWRSPYSPVPVLHFWELTVSWGYNSSVAPVLCQS